MCIENSSNINQNMRRLSLANSLSYYPLNQKGGSSYQMEEQGFQKDHLKAAAFLIIALLLFKTVTCLKITMGILTGSFLSFVK